MQRNPNKEFHQTGLRMPTELANWCKSMAKASGMTLNSWLMSLVCEKRERVERYQFNEPEPESKQNTA